MAESKKKFKDSDLIECRSITVGKLVFEGKKSGNVYRFPSYNSVEPVEYRDLLYAVRDVREGSLVYKPRFIVMDDEFINENPKLKEFYDSLYNYKNIEEILNLPVGQMKSVIMGLPSGIQESLKGIIATAIKNGKLDSVKKIKALDGIFDTQMLMMLASE